MSLRRRNFKRGNFGFVRRVFTAIVPFLGCELRLVEPLICEFSVDVIDIFAVDGAEGWDEEDKGLLIVLEGRDL